MKHLTAKLYEDNLGILCHRYSYCIQVWESPLYDTCLQPCCHAISLSDCTQNYNYLCGSSAIIHTSECSRNYTNTAVTCCWMFINRADAWVKLWNITACWQTCSHFSDNTTSIKKYHSSCSGSACIQQCNNRACNNPPGNFFLNCHILGCNYFEKIIKQHTDRVVIWRPRLEIG